MYFYYFTIISLWEGCSPSFEQTWILLCAKFGWNWPVVLEKKIFKLSIYFYYFPIISPLGRAWPFIWTSLNPLYPGILCAKFGWNWPSGSDEDENVKSLRTDDGQQVIRKAHLSFQLSWANKNSWVRIFLTLIQLKGHTFLQWYKIVIRYGYVD